MSSGYECDSTMDSLDLTFSSHKGEIVYDPLKGNSELVRDKFLMESGKLDEYQREVLKLDINVPSRITANAGAGKTFTIVLTALNMIVQHEVPAENIVLITFTAKAAREIKDRFVGFFRGVVSDKLPCSLRTPHISTVHSFGYTVFNSLFGLHRTIIAEYKSHKMFRNAIKVATGLDTVDSQTLYRVYESYTAMVENGELWMCIYPELGLDGKMVEVHDSLNTESHRVQSAVQLLGRFSRSGMERRLYGNTTDMTPSERQSIVEFYAEKGGVDLDVFKKILINYYVTKYSSGCCDFGDMFTLPLTMIALNMSYLKLSWSKWKHFIMDEAQDSSAGQLGLVLFLDSDSFNRINPGYFDSLL